MILVQLIVTPGKLMQNKCLGAFCHTKCLHKNNSLWQQSCVRCVLPRAYGISPTSLILKIDIQNNA